MTIFQAAGMFVQVVGPVLLLAAVVDRLDDRYLRWLDLQRRRLSGGDER